VGARAGIAGRRRVVTASATPFADLPLSDRDRPWDAAAADQRVREWAADDPARYAKSQFCGDLGFCDVVDGELTAIWRGVTTAAGVLQGAHGGIALADDDRADVRSHIGRYYAKAQQAYDDDTIEAPWTSELAAKMTGECANGDCGHDAMAHEGDDNAGACTAEGCSCSAFEMADTASSMSAFVRIRPELEPEFHVKLGETVSEAITLGFRDIFADLELPDGLRPSDVRPAANPSAEVEVPEPPPNGALAWSAKLAPEGKITDDGRIFAPGSIKWRGLPLSLMAMTKTPGEGGHAGAELSGRIDRIWRDETSLPYWINGEGVFDDSEFGREIARLVGDETLRGNSVDLAIREAEFGPRSAYVDEFGLWRDDAPEPGADERDIAEILFSDEEDIIMVVRDASIGMSTVCPFPAFEDAGIALVAAADGQPAFAIVPDATGFRWRIWIQDAFQSHGEVLTASAAGMVPVEPPAEWFEQAELEELTPLTVTDEGRIFGHAWGWDSCHLGLPGCTTPPASSSDYEFFHLKEVLCEDGQRVAVGTITLGTGHANTRLGKGAAIEHYDHTGTAVADVRIYEDEFGGQVVGALRPDTPAARVRELRGATVSGDWRPVNGFLELVGLLAVNVPGFPVPRTKAIVAATENGGQEILALVAAGIVLEHRLEPSDRATLAALAARASGGLEALAELASSEPPPAIPAGPAPVALSHREKIEAALVAAGVEMPAEPVETSYELTNGSLTERRFLSEAIAAGYRETKRIEWPSEDALGEHGEVLARDGDSAVFRLEDGSLVYAHVGHGWANFRIATVARARGDELAAEFQALYPPLFRQTDDRQVVPITFWTLGRFGPTSRMRMIDSASWDDVGDNYTATVRGELERLMNEFEPGKSGQLLLWDGPPGTGKTWALRALASQWSQWAEFSYITDPDQFFVSDPSYMIDVLLSDTYESLTVDGDVVHELATDGKWRVLILEDTGALLSADADDTYAQGLARLLNVVDGMVGQGLRVLALVTTNQEIESMHPAVTRPGRCASQISFAPLTADEAIAWASERGVETDGEPHTLAELYAAAGTAAPAIADDDPASEPEAA
jgi:hypothetical protein